MFQFFIMSKAWYDLAPACFYDFISCHSTSLSKVSVTLAFGLSLPLLRLSMYHDFIFALLYA